MRHLVFLASVLALGVGCGGSGTTAPGDVTTMRDWLATNNAALCQARFKCCSPADAMLRDPRKPDAASCTAALNTEVQTVFDASTLAKALASGTVTYDSAAGAACLSSLQAPRDSCDSVALEVTAAAKSCLTMVYGNLPLDARCSGSIPTCARGTYCTTQLHGDNGTCRPFGQANEKCGDLQLCDAGLICSPSSVCAAPLDDGQKCTSLIQCKSLTCQSGTCVSRTRPPVCLGE